MTLPTTLRAGDTYSQLVELADYPASAGWVLKSRFVPRAGGTAIALTATADGDAHQLDAAAATTTSWAVGDYSAVQWVELGAEVYTVATGQLSILPNLRTVVSGDTRTQAELALAAARAALAAWTPTQRRYKIGEREMEFASTAEILRTISYWEQQVAREQGTAAASLGGRYYIRAR